MTTSKKEITVTIATATLRRLIAMKSKIGPTFSNDQIVSAAIARFSWITAAAEARTPDAFVEHESTGGFSFETDIPVFELEDDSDYEGQFVISVSESEGLAIEAAFAKARSVTSTEVSKIGFIRACLRNFLSAFGNEQRGFTSTLRLANDEAFQEQMKTCDEFIVEQSIDVAVAPISANTDQRELIELLRDELSNNYIQSVSEGEIMSAFAKVHPEQTSKKGKSFSLFNVLGFSMKEYPELCGKETV